MTMAAVTVSVQLTSQELNAAATPTFTLVLDDISEGTEEIIVEQAADAVRAAFSTLRRRATKKRKAGSDG